MVGGVLEGEGFGGEPQREEGVHHDRELVGRPRPDRLLVGSRVRAVRDARGVERDRLRADAAPAREVAADVVDELVAVDRGVRVGAGDRVGVRVGDARDEGADEGAARGERGVDRRREVDEARLRLVGEDREGERPDGAVPADDVERETRRGRARTNGRPS